MAAAGTDRPKVKGKSKRSETPPPHKKPCTFWMKGTCKNTKEQCAEKGFGHPPDCRAFKKGKCDKTDCKYRHLKKGTAAPAAGSEANATPATPAAKAEPKAKSLTWKAKAKARGWKQGDMWSAVGAKVGRAVAATMVVAAHTLGFCPAEMHNFAENCTYVPDSELKSSHINVADMFTDDIDDFDDQPYVIEYAAFPAYVAGWEIPMKQSEESLGEVGAKVSPKSCLQQHEIDGSAAKK